MFLIVGCSERGCSMPKKRRTYEESYRWMVERTANDIRDIYGAIADSTGSDLEFMSDEKVIEWMRGYSSDFVLTEKHSKIVCDDGSFYDRWIFDIDKI